MFFERFNDININTKAKGTIIDPKLACMYYYKVEIFPDVFVVHFPMPKNFERDKIKISFNKDMSAVSVCPHNNIPIFKGKLYAPVLDYRTNIQDNDFIIIFRKSNLDKWPQIITDYFPGTEEIDPQSAFILFQELSDDSNTFDRSLQFLTSSCKLGYVRAMVTVAHMDFNFELADQVKQGKELFNIATEYYKEPRAMVHYAEVLIHMNEAYAPKAIKLYRRAIELGNDDAHMLLGRALSPLSNVKNSERNAEEAVKELELGLKCENPIAYHELAKLYYNGVGVEKDIAKANELQQKALKMNPNMEPIDDMLVKPKKLLTVFAVLLIALIIGIFFAK